jgi:hypothetical protein
MIGIMATGIAISAVRLVVGVWQKDDFCTPGQLLSLRAGIWSTNLIAFALRYWHLDSGGPVAGAHRSNTRLPAFRFPEHDLDSLMSSGWYPQFVDYLALSCNTATAFGPADVPAIRHWPKCGLMAESAISLVLAALVVARAVKAL